MIIDTHAHVYSQELLQDQVAMLLRAEQSGVEKILMPAIDSTTHINMLHLESAYPTLCLSMMGLHPTSVKENYEEELHIVERHLQTRKFIAIGETGLDFYWDTTYKQQQYLAFEQQILWALQYNIPIVIHSRNSINECIELVAQYVDKGLKGVFHCFSGNIDQAHKIIELGFYLGIGGVLTFKNAGLDKVINDIALDQVVLETDAPYLAPVPFRGKLNEPSYITYVVQKMAELKGLSVTTMAELTSLNAKKLFKL